ncbi:ABC transporter permease subunit [Salipaludibacillus agaradhaerens]|uniref:nickel/cobalt ABC transporter permease n=1 Tax=Salipaludibacillus agaradhaerens TaxID=76935 RepID=UPI0021517D05|nr:nickel/cobalt ABC transporter permease [Salipaludibacillus agaradhaerens]MCR6105470.1 ABC transporter permease subunit [Salipaludibacillus agaradhaerens]MCR6117508.1 ABC transporter permease subunit [Salipaludibacillus agaradhaerens]UJW56697.1 ABC transporter permease subunit [Bacillus sp. A116_S68]
MSDLLKKVIKDRLAIVSLTVILLTLMVGVLAPFIVPNDPNLIDVVNKFAKPSFSYPLGTDQSGRCLFSRLLFGIRTTLFLALFTMIVTISIGTILGIISGYFKGWIDNIMMRLCDIMLSFPSQVMILAIVGMLGPGIFNVIIANIVVKWAWYTRMIRGSVIQASETNYILYSKAVGTSTSFILSKHVLPHSFSQIIVLATLDTGWVILNISALSFLGLGIQPPTAEWGSMLSEARNVWMSQPLQMLYPGLAIVIIVAAFNYLGDSLRDIRDPKDA